MDSPPTGRSVWLWTPHRPMALRFLITLFLFVAFATGRSKEKLTPWEPNYCNDTKLQDSAGLKKTALGQFLGYDCDMIFYQCRWSVEGWKTYRKECRKGLYYDTTGTQNCNYDFNVDGCGQKQCADCFGDQFPCCLSEECVELGQRCDGHYDCLLEEDEQNCPTCKAGQFGCVISEQCIPIEQRCNGIKDCQDGTDEKHCDECPQDMFYCLKSEICVEKELKCDGKKDCSQGEDEAFCRYDTKRNYTCRNQVNSVPMHQLCDGMEDCPDGSDEAHCIINYDGQEEEEVEGEPSNAGDADNAPANERSGSTYFYDEEE